MAYVMDEVGDKIQKELQPKRANSKSNVPVDMTPSGIPLHLTGPSIFDYKAGNMSEEQLAVFSGRPNTTTTPQNYEQEVNKKGVVKTTDPVFNAHIQSDDPSDQSRFPRVTPFTSLPLPSPLPPEYQLNFPNTAVDLGSQDPYKGFTRDPRRALP